MPKANAWEPALREIKTPSGELFKFPDDFEKYDQTQLILMILDFVKSNNKSALAEMTTYLNKSSESSFWQGVRRWRWKHQGDPEPTPASTKGYSPIPKVAGTKQFVPAAAITPTPAPAPVPTATPVVTAPVVAPAPIATPSPVSAPVTPVQTAPTAPPEAPEVESEEPAEVPKVDPTFPTQEDIDPPEPQVHISKPEITYSTADFKPTNVISCLDDEHIATAMRQFFKAVETLVKAWESKFPAKERLIDPDTVSADRMDIIPMGSTKAVLPYVLDIATNMLCLPLPNGWGVMIAEMPVSPKQVMNLMATKGSTFSRGKAPAVAYPPVLRIMRNLVERSGASKTEQNKFGEPGPYNCIEDEGTVQFATALLRRL